MPPMFFKSPLDNITNLLNNICVTILYYTIMRDFHYIFINFLLSMTRPKIRTAIGRWKLKDSRIVEKMKFYDNCYRG